MELGFQPFSEIFWSSDSYRDVFDWADSYRGCHLSIQPRGDRHAILLWGIINSSHQFSSQHLDIGIWISHQLACPYQELFTKKTSSSLKFCQDFVNVQVFTVNPGTVPENRHFLRKVNPITVVVLQTNLADLVVYQSGRTGNFVTMKLIATRKRKWK